MAFHYAVNTLANPLNNGRHKSNQDNFLIQAGNKSHYLNHAPDSNSNTTSNTTSTSRDNEQPCISIEQSSGKSCLAILDGIGSLENSANLTTQLCQKLSEIPQNLTAEALTDEITTLHQQFQQQFNGHSNTAGSTLTLLDFISDNSANLLHIGDSRLFEIDQHKVTNLTIDASEANQRLMIDADRQDQINSQTSNLLLHAFAVGNSYQDKLRRGKSYKQLAFLTAQQLPGPLKLLADIRPITLSAEKYYLLATDGLFDVVNADEFIALWPGIVNNSKSPSLADKLDALFSQLSHHLNEQHAYYADNATAILFRTDAD